MSDVRDLERANARALEDVGAADRLFGEIRSMSTRERTLHPALDHWRQADAALEESRRVLGALRDGVQLLEAERRHRLHADRLAVAEAARGKEAERLDRCRRDNEATLRAGGPGHPSRDPAILEAGRVMKLRIDVLAAGLASAGDEAAFSAVIDDLDAATKSFASAVGVARRACRMRKSAAAASAAVDAFRSAA